MVQLAFQTRYDPRRVSPGFGHGIEQQRIDGNGDSTSFVGDTSNELW